MCEVITSRTPASIAATNGTSSRSCSSERDRAMTGRARWESIAVSPCPGKCLAVAATPVSCSARIHAAPCRATTSGSSLKLRTPITGLSGLELMSTLGAKFTLTPAWRSCAPIWRAAYAVVSRSSSRPSTALPGEGEPSRAKSRVTSPPSSSMAIRARGFSA